MVFYSACAAALVFMIGGIIIYRLGLNDGLTLRKNGGGLFAGKKDKEVGDWQSIIGFDPKK